MVKVSGMRILWLKGGQKVEIQHINEDEEPRFMKWDKMRSGQIIKKGQDE